MISIIKNKNKKQMPAPETSKADLAAETVDKLPATKDAEGNEAQRQAIHHMDGPMMVLAGPGSGKTFVITRRIRALIENKVAPENILVITFTKASALEMQQRFLSLMDQAYAPVSFGTFHAIYFNILKRAYHYDYSNIITEKEKRIFMRQVAERFPEETIDDSWVELLLAAISKVKNEGIVPKEYSVPYLPEGLFPEIYHCYDQLLRQYKKIDFDDMVLLCYELLKNDPEELALWQGIYKYILIDEFQDINQMQYEVIKMLALPENNLFIVGDDDQSIYGFRGSKPQIMLHFPEEYENCRQVVLSKNYRSTGQIVDHATKLIANNRNRYQKQLESVHEKGREIHVTVYEDKQTQGRKIAGWMKNKVESGEYCYSDFAIIIRTNAGARSLLPVLTEESIPYIFREKIVSVFEHTIAKDINAMLAFVFSSPKRNDLFRFMNKPVRYIRRDLFETPLVDFNMAMANCNKTYLRENLKNLQYHLEKMKDMPLYAALNYFLKGMGYEMYLRERIRAKEFEEEEAKEILSIIKMGLSKVAGYENWLDYMYNYERELAEAASEDTKKDGVTIITMHSSKGLEYPVVFLPDLNEGNVPQKKSQRQEEIEEERRVFYVALTRAKQELYLSYIKETKENRLIKSRFLNQMFSSSSFMSISSSNS